MTASLFEAAPAGASASYTAMRDGTNPVAIEARDHCEDLWRDYGQYADEHFRSEFSLRTHERWFEMYLTVALLRAGLNVQCPKPGPDILLTADGRRIWIEATCATAGEPGLPDSVPEPKVAKAGDPPVVTEVPIDAITLRIRNSLHTKEQVFRGYIDNGIVAADEVTVVAINVHAVPHAWADMDDFMRRALYGLGHPTITINKDTMKAVDSGYQEQLTIGKKSTGKDVSIDPFVNGSMAHVSAVLGSREDAANRPPRIGDGLLLLPNLSVHTQWPKGAIPLGQEWVPAATTDTHITLAKMSYIEGAETDSQ